MQDIFSSTRSYASLSLKDLLDAREEKHFDLMNKKNVIATAIGYYRIRKTDPWPTKEQPNMPGKKTNEPRTLDNSEVRPYSWPAVFVFVQNWLTEDELKSQSPSEAVEKLLILQDGRKVPVCVIHAPLQASTKNEVVEDQLLFPRNLISGGFPLIVNSQHQKRIASVGCLVTDGHTVYALTNKHVAGNSGTVIYSKLAGDEQAIGITSDYTVGRIPFKQVYPNWPGNYAYVNMDIGLIEVNNLNQWQTEVYQIGEMGKLADLHTGNITLNLIGARVAGYGAVSGKIFGEIQALFYRYKSVGGYEYLSDFLIGTPDGEKLNLHHGDSGTILMYEHNGSTTEENSWMPIGVLWGQHEMVDGPNNTVHPYGLATNLSSVLNHFEVDLVRGWNIDQNYIWGKVGHYTVGYWSVQCVTTRGNFKTFIHNNAGNISLKLEKINSDLDSKTNTDLVKDPTKGFCALADVPDIIWKQSKSYIDKKDGTKKGFKWGRKGDENPNHYADADFPVNGKTLYDYCNAAKKLTVEVWTKYYDDVDDANQVSKKERNTSKMGLLCFRVWQIYDYLVDAANHSHADKFIFGAGVLAHYIGDACQPLHGSYMSDGDPADNETIKYIPPRGGSKHPKGVPYDKVVNPGSGVHVAYEDHMVDDFIDDIREGIQIALVDSNSEVMKESIPSITNGQEAGYAILQLMKITQKAIPPKKIVETFKKYKGDRTELSQRLFDAYGTLTIECMARGSRYLAAVWEAAWNNSSKKITKFGKVTDDKLRSLYKNPNELPSLHLDTIKPILK